MENTTAGEAPVIKFDAKALAPLALLMAKQDIRYYLCGICVTPSPDGNGCLLIATDARRIAVWHNQEGECSRETILTISPALVAASRKGTKDSKPSSVTMENGRLILKAAFGTEVFVQVANEEGAASPAPSGSNSGEVAQ